MAEVTSYDNDILDLHHADRVVSVNNLPEGFSLVDGVYANGTYGTVTVTNGVAIYTQNKPFLGHREDGQDVVAHADKVAISLKLPDGTVLEKAIQVDVAITDATPEAYDDFTSVSEIIPSITGNVVLGVENAKGENVGADRPQADGLRALDLGGSVEWRPAANLGELSADGKVLHTAYGDLTLGSDGQYAFNLNTNSEAYKALAKDSDIQLDVDYALVDADGDRAPAILHIRITGGVKDKGAELQPETLEVKESGVFDAVQDVAHQNSLGGLSSLENPATSEGGLGFSNHLLTATGTLVAKDGASLEGLLFTTKDLYGAKGFQRLAKLGSEDKIEEVPVTASLLEESSSNPVFDPSEVLGTFYLNSATGEYRFELDDSKVNQLALGDVLSIHLPIRGLDAKGTASEASVTIKVHGTNDAPTLEVSKKELALSLEGSSSQKGLAQAYDVDQGDENSLEYRFILNDSLQDKDATGKTLIDLYSESGLKVGSLWLDSNSGEYGVEVEETFLQSQPDQLHLAKAGDKFILTKDDQQKVDIILRVYDQHDAHAEEKLDLYVGGVNQAPRLEGPSHLLLKESGVFGDNEATIPDNDGAFEALGNEHKLVATGQFSKVEDDFAFEKLTFQLATGGQECVVKASDKVFGLEPGAILGTFRIDAKTGQYSFTLDDKVVDSLPEGQTITVSTPPVVAIDTYGVASEAKTINITVFGTNDKPEITLYSKNVYEGLPLLHTKASGVDQEGNFVAGQAVDSGRSFTQDVDSLDDHRYILVDDQGVEATSIPVYCQNLVTGEYNILAGHVSIDTGSGEYSFTLDNAQLSKIPNNAIKDLSEGQLAHLGRLVNGEDNKLILALDEVMALDEHVTPVDLKVRVYDGSSKNASFEDHGANDSAAFKIEVEGTYDRPNIQNHSVFVNEAGTLDQSAYFDPRTDAGISHYDGDGFHHTGYGVRTVFDALGNKILKGSFRRLENYSSHDYTVSADESGANLTYSVRDDEGSWTKVSETPDAQGWFTFSHKALNIEIGKVEFSGKTVTFSLNGDPKKDLLGSENFDKGFEVKLGAITYHLAIDTNGQGTLELEESFSKDLAGETLPIEFGALTCNVVVNAKADSKGSYSASLQIPVEEGFCEFKYKATGEYQLIIHEDLADAIPVTYLNHYNRHNLTITAKDEKSGLESEPAKLSFRISGANDRPEFEHSLSLAKEAPLVTLEDNAGVVTGQVQAEDPDSLVLNYAIITKVENADGELVNANAGTYMTRETYHHYVNNWGNDGVAVTNQDGMVLTEKGTYANLNDLAWQGEKFLVVKAPRPSDDQNNIDGRHNSQELMTLMGDLSKIEYNEANMQNWLQTLGEKTTVYGYNGYNKAGMLLSLPSEDKLSQEVQGQYGTLSINSTTGEYTYTLDPQKVAKLGKGEEASETFSLVVKDHKGAFDIKDVSFKVRGCADVDEDYTRAEAGVIAVTEDGANFVRTDDKADSFKFTPSQDGSTKIVVQYEGGSQELGEIVVKTDESGSPLLSADGLPEYEFKASEASFAVKYLGEDLKASDGKCLLARGTQIGHIQIDGIAKSQDGTLEVKYHFELEKEGGVEKVQGLNMDQVLKPENLTGLGSLKFQAMDASLKEELTHQPLHLWVQGANDAPLIHQCLNADGVALNPGADGIYALSTNPITSRDLAVMTVKGSDVDGSDADLRYCGLDNDLKQQTLIGKQGYLTIDDKTGRLEYHAFAKAALNYEGDKEDIFTIAVFDPQGERSTLQVKCSVTGEPEISQGNGGTSDDQGAMGQSQDPGQVHDDSLSDDQKVRAQGPDTGNVYEDGGVDGTKPMNLDLGLSTAEPVSGKEIIYNGGQTVMRGSCGCLILKSQESGVAYEYRLDNYNDAVQGLLSDNVVTEEFKVPLQFKGSNQISYEKVLVTVQGLDDNPELHVSRTLIVQEGNDEAVSAYSYAQDSDVDKEITYSLEVDEESSKYGTFAIDPHDKITFKIDNNSEAVRALKVDTIKTLTVKVKATDKQGNESEQNINVDIIGKNTAADIVFKDPEGLDTHELKVTEGNVLTGKVDIYDIDGSINNVILNLHKVSDHTATSTTVQTKYGTVSLVKSEDETYNYTYTPNGSLKDGEEKDDSFTIKAVDNNGLPHTETIIVHLEGKNDLPFINGTTKELSKGEVNICDPDVDDSHTISVLIGDREYSLSDGKYQMDDGLLAISENSKGDGWTYTFTPFSHVLLKMGLNDKVSHDFRLKISDSSNGSVLTEPLTISYTGTNKAPTIGLVNAKGEAVKMSPDGLTSVEDKPESVS